MSQSPHYVVVGNGPAGNAAAETLRERAPAARVTLLSDEPFHFYNRCKLPEYVAGQIDEATLALRTADDYRERNIKLRLGQKVVDFDPSAKTLTLDHREKLSFDAAILATGGRPRMPQPLRDSAAHVRTLKDLFDARQWRRALDEGAESVLLVGGDLVSVRFARCLAKAGKKVTLSLWKEAFWPLELDEKVAAGIVASLEKKGVRVLTTERFTGCDPTPDGILCRYTHGADELFDLIGGFFGYEPEVSVLGSTGLQLDRGVLVDEHLKSNYAGVYVAGDAAQVYNPDLADYWVSIGWKNAEALGKLAACNLLGFEREATGGEQSYLDLEGVRVNTAWWTEV